MFHALALGVAAGALPQSSQAQPAQGKRLIVDSQIHIWKADTPERPWVKGAVAQLPEPMTIERLVPIMDDSGVDKVVVVPPSLEGTRFDYGQEAARRHPGRFATMGRVNLNDPAEKERVPRMLDAPHLMGARFYFQPSTAKWLSDGTADWFWPVAEAVRLPVMFLTVNQTPAFAAIAEKHPQLPLIIDHLGVTIESVKDGSMPTRIAETVALAKYPNVSVKLSSTPLYSAQSYPWRDMDDHIKRVFDAYGPQRCHWGSDITNSFDRGSMKQRITHFTEELRFLSEEDKDWIMGRSILAKLRWA
ncbi:MAG: amidohydrolase [Beijerinckiaceae bacterium]|nr:amidohydrolase [Beijerinckiaceae bacterium]